MLTIEHSVLLVIDVQGKLASMMYDLKYLKCIRAMITAAKMFEAPIIVTEQAPEKIGSTIDSITAMTSGATYVAKQAFSCCGESEFLNALKRTGRRQVIVTGIESHVCVYQTVRDLIKARYEVYLLADAVSARHEVNCDIGLRRSEREGAILSTMEMTLTELMQSTHHPKFREIMALLKDNT